METIESGTCGEESELPVDFLNDTAMSTTSAGTSFSYWAKLQTFSIKFVSSCGLKSDSGDYDTAHFLKLSIRMG